MAPEPQQGVEAIDGLVGVESGSVSLGQKNGVDTTRRDTCSHAKAPCKAVSQPTCACVMLDPRHHNFAIINSDYTL